MATIPAPTIASEIFETPYLDIAFPVQGTHLPADHGYWLYAAMTRTVPTLHGASWLGVELISGIPWDKGMVALPAHGVSLHLRLPISHFADVLPLAGKRLEIAGYAIRLGAPLARPLRAAASLYARIVTIKKFMEPVSFLEAAHRQLAALGIKATLELPYDQDTRYRRIISIHGKKVVGFSLVVHRLNDTASLALQSLGLGGRRAMGCGFFKPIVNASRR